MSVVDSIGKYFSLVKFAHTVFALPFALVGFLLGLQEPGACFTWVLLLQILGCMVFARSAAMGFNRYADRAIDAGARFIVSPGFNPKVTEYVLKKGVPMTPGVCTPTEIEAALQFDLDVLKFFPAEPAGGLKMIKALAAPYVGVNFMPTGGISASNVREYLAYDRIVACGGSWMVSGKLVKEGKFDEIENLVREAADIVKEIRG